MKGFTKDIPETDISLAARLLAQIVDSLYFDPAILVTLMLDLKTRNKLVDRRKGPRVAFFDNVDYAAVARPVPKLSL